MQFVSWYIHVKYDEGWANNTGLACIQVLHVESQMYPQVKAELHYSHIIQPLFTCWINVILYLTYNPASKKVPSFQMLILTVLLKEEVTHQNEKHDHVPTFPSNDDH